MMATGQLRCRLTFEQGALALDAPAIAGQAAIAAYNTIAGDGHRQDVGGTGAGDRPRQSGRTNAARELAVARCPAR